MILNQLALYSPECVTLLKQALDVAIAAAAVEQQQQGSYQRDGFRALHHHSKYADSSDDEEKDGDCKLDSYSSNSESSEEADADEEEKSSYHSGSEKSLIHDDTNGTERVPTIERDNRQAKQEANSKKTKKKRDTIDQRQKEILIRKHLDSIPCSSLPLNDPPNSFVEIPMACLSKDTRQAQDLVQECKSFLSLAISMQQQEKPVIVLFLRSGKFAGAVYKRDQCVTHRTHQRYTVRGKQGKAQSAQDSQRRPKSVGSQLRRAGELALQEDVRQTLTDWKEYMNDCAIIWISCPRTMQKTLFQGVEDFFNKNDPRIRRVPLDLGRPTFEHVNLIYAALSTVTVRENAQETSPPELCQESSTREETSVPKTVQPEPKIIIERQIHYAPLAAWHVAAKNGDIQVIRDLLSLQEGINDLAGEDGMSPLHFAAESTSHGVDASIAAECVYEMLVDGRADPCLVDARNRPPYFLAGHERVRDAFRRARAKLGEAYCSWEASKIGPPLTEEDLELRKLKEADKRRKKRAKQKDKKQKEKSIAEEIEQKQKEEEERQKQEAEAKRIRDGLQPKSNTSGNVCDFCLQECKGRRRNQMFKRLDYAYCSTECVQKHKRELMASAAMARFGG